MNIGMLAVLTLGGLTVACSSDTVSDPTAGVNPATAGSGPVNSGPTSFSAELLESVNEVPILTRQFTVRALDNTTGQPLPGFEAVSDSNSWVFFNSLPPGPVGFLIVGVITEGIDTYQFNIDSNAQNETLWVVAKSSVQMGQTLANVMTDPEKATIAGALYWRDPNGAELEIGCSTVTIDDGIGEIRYFAENNLPTTDVARPEYPDQEVRTTSNPRNGKYYIGNATPGQRTITLWINGQNLGTTTLVAFANKNSTDGEHSISISNIYVEGPANPTPPDCN